MRTLHNWLLTIIGLLLFTMVMWVVERDPLVGYALGIALVMGGFYVVLERVGPKR
jgi:hypothetical protein